MEDAGKFLGSTSRYKGLPPFPLSRFASAKFVAFLPSFVLSANSNELAKNCQLEIVAHAHDGIRGFCTEWLRVGNFLPTRSSWQFSANSTWQTRKKLGRNSVEFVPNLADTPRTWQKKNELGRKGSELGRSSFRQNRTTSVPSEAHRQMT